MNRWAIKRRDILKHLGLGAAALPLLNATRPARAASAFPRRAVIVIQTNGLAINSWKNTVTTADIKSATLPSVLAPLEPHKSDLIILPELANPGFMGAGHGAYGTIFSPGPNNPAPEYWTPQVATLDQVCGAAVMKTAKLPALSLPLQVQPDSSESRLGAYRCFFSGNDKAVTPETNPYKLSDRLFAGKPMGDPTMDRLRAERKSMLDFVGADLMRFGRNLGTDDRNAISAHLQSIRDVETQLSAVTASATCKAPSLGTPVALPENDSYPALLKINLDITTAALRCDYTRVVTVVLSNAFGADVTFSWLGIQGKGLDGNRPVRTWHDCAHVEMRGAVNDKVAIDTWFMGQFAYLLAALKGTPEGGGNMLDNSVVLWANHMENGAGHNAMKLPWILAGSAGGVFKTGQILKPAKQIEKTRVMCEIANAMGANLPYFGAAEYGSPLPEIRA